MEMIYIKNITLNVINFNFTYHKIIQKLKYCMFFYLNNYLFYVFLKKNFYLLNLMICKEENKE